MKKQSYLKNILQLSALLGILFYIIRATFRKGDFIGYVQAGNLVLNQQDIYLDYLNTWPPFFSVFCVPLALLDSVTSTGVRFVWLVLSVIAFFWCMRISINWVYSKKLVLPFQKAKENEIEFSDWRVFVPFLLSYRYVLENLSNIQINIFLLLLAILSIEFYFRNKHTIVAALLSFGISLKIYPIFLLLYFGFKRAYKVFVGGVLIFFLFNAISFWVFGTEQALAFYQHWWHEIASPYPSVQHKNQSFFSLLRSLFVNESPGLGIYLNIADVSLDNLKKIGYGILLIGASFCMVQFRKSIQNTPKSLLLIELAFVLTAIPILSPVAWKAYFIFLWFGNLLAFYYLFYDEKIQQLRQLKYWKGLFYLMIALTVFSTDLFLGSWLADLTEVFSFITLGTLILMGLLLILYKAVRKSEVV